MSFTPRHPTEIRLAVESAFDDSNLIDYSCAEIERLERELAEKVSAISDVTTRLAELDPDPVVCGCHEAQCPHTPIATMPRTELVKYYRERIKAAEVERDQLVSMDNAAMDKMQAMIREQSERIVAVASYAELLEGSVMKVCPTIQAVLLRLPATGFENMKDDLREVLATLGVALSHDQTGSAKAAGAPGAESTAAPTNERHETCKHGTPRTMYDAGITSADCSKCAAEAFGHQSCTQFTEASPDTIEDCKRLSLVGWLREITSGWLWTDEASSRPFVDALIERGKELEQELRHQVNRDPLAVLDEWSKKNKAPGDHPEFWRGYHYAREVLYGDSQSVACKKQG